MSTSLVPLPYMLGSLSRLRLSWHDALGELIDNAIDAGATEIRIVGRPHDLAVTDNGCGCADVLQMLRLGAHTEYETTQSGIFGMGGKQVMLWLWGTTKVWSVTEPGAIVHGSMDWAKTTTWDAPELHIAPSSEWPKHGLLGPTGTRIVYLPGRKRHIEHIATDPVLRDLAWTFRPALEAGTRITVTYMGRGGPIGPPAFPRLIESDMISGDIQGKPFSVLFGVIDNSESKSRSGFHLARGPRVIEKTTEPANGFDCSRFFAWVSLDPQYWTPSLNKNQLDDDDRSALMSALGELCREMLTKADEWANDILNDEIEAEISSTVSAVLNPEFADAINVKAKRHAPEHNTGAVAPVATGRTHKRAKRVQGGAKILSTPDAEPRRIQGLRFRLDHLDAGQFYLVTPQVKQLTVTFNSDLLLVRQLAQQPDREALKAMAMAAAIVHVTTHDELQKLLPRMSGEDPETALQRTWCGWNAAIAATRE